MGENHLVSRVKALIVFRVAFVTLMLGSFFFFRIQYLSLPYPRAISYFIITLYSLTILYALSLNRVRNLFYFGYAQLVVDVFSEIVLIIVTGGIQSWFTFTMILTVMSSSIVLNKRAGYVIASLCSILYGIVVDLQYFQLLPIPYEETILDKGFIYNVFITILALYLTAYLSGYLSYRLETAVQKLEEKDTHFKDLEFFNIKVIESLPSGLFTTDNFGEVQIFNRAAEKISGQDREGVVGKNICDVLTFLTIPLEEGRREAILEKEGQEQRIIGITVSKLLDISGHETGFIGVFQDLTQLKKLEEEMKLKEKWAAIGELSANIAHEIRNPLASLRSSIEMLRDGKIPVKHKEKLMGIAQQEMDRLNGIITDFLIYSRPKELQPERMDVHSALSETVELLKASIQNRQTSITKEYRGSLFVNADPQKMRQVFWNLGTNALEAMPNGGELSIATERQAGSVRIVFSDTGEGIRPSDTDRIFYPFFTTKDRGTGLGLAIAYRIIDEHSGSLRVESQPGIKTSFEIILPG